MKFRNLCLFLTSLYFFSCTSTVPKIENISYAERVSIMNKKLVSMFNHNDETQKIFVLGSDKGLLYVALKDYNIKNSFDLGDALNIWYYDLSNNLSSTKYTFLYPERIEKIEKSKLDEKTTFINPDSLQYLNYIKTLEIFLK